MRWLVVALLLFGCSTSSITKKPDRDEISPREPKMPRRSKCPDRIKVKDGVEPWNDYDKRLIPGMNDGCRRHFSAAHCAVEITKTSVQEYAIKCGFVEHSGDD